MDDCNVDIFNVEGFIEGLNVDGLVLEGFKEEILNNEGFEVSSMLTQL